MPHDLEGDTLDIRESLQNLLVIIHRDGGHYSAEHGIEKATEDAAKIIYDLREEIGNLREELQRSQMDLNRSGFMGN